MVFVSNAFSVRTRWQKPCMVDICAKSMLSRASLIRFSLSSSVPGASFAMALWISFSPAVSAPLRWSANLRRLSLTRPRSSLVAASVNVTAKILSTGVPSIMARRMMLVMEKVLPVPALASMRMLSPNGIFFFKSSFAGLGIGYLQMFFNRLDSLFALV